LTRFSSAADLGTMPHVCAGAQEDFDALAVRAEAALALDRLPLACR
jgi:hypothetical protein